MPSLQRGRSSPLGVKPRVVLSANSFWNVVNFREPLILALVDEGYSVTIAAPDADADWAGKRGASAIAIAIDRSGLNPLNDGLLAIDYLRLFRKDETRLFLGFTAKPNIYGSLAAALCGVASLPNVSGLGTAFMTNGALSQFVSWLYRLAFRRCPIVFFQNPDDRDLFVQREIVTTDQARLLPGSGIDLERFPAVPMPAEVEGRRFLFIGRLLGDKGVREFAEAARLLRPKWPRWRFQLLGDIDPDNRSGIARSEVQQWVEQGLVEHLGHTDDVRPHIAAASAIVLPSYREGMPRSLLEGAAMGRPLIATDVPGNRQLVEHGVNGLLCEARDPQSLAAAMGHLGGLKEVQLAEMGRAGRARVERDFAVAGVIRAYLDALAQLTNLLKC